MAGFNCEIKWATRLCEVDGKLGYFHCWEHWANVCLTIKSKTEGYGPTEHQVSEVSAVIKEG